MSLNVTIRNRNVNRMLYDFLNIIKCNKLKDIYSYRKKTKGSKLKGKGLGRGRGKGLDRGRGRGKGKRPDR